MLHLRAAVAEAKAAAVERRSREAVSKAPNTKRKRLRALEVEVHSKNKGIEGRIISDEQTHKNSFRKLKHVKQALEIKAKKYDDMMTIGEEKNSDEVTRNENILVDFERKKSILIAEQSLDQPKFDQIQDEFGREKTVPIDSSEYRNYIAEEARKIRLEGIQMTQRQRLQGYESCDPYLAYKTPHVDGNSKY